MVEIGCYFAHEERELLGNVDAYKGFVGDVRLAIGEAEHHVEQPTDAVQTRRARRYASAVVA